MLKRGSVRGDPYGAGEKYLIFDLMVSNERSNQAIHKSKIIKSFGSACEKYELKQV